ncbi:MAG: hypothetical protein ABSE89_11815 [Sedimentisphaerales bacterium]
MKKGILFAIAIMLISGGCEQQQKKASGFKGQLLLSVDFEPNVPLVYKFVSERQIMLDLDPSGKYSKDRKDKGATQSMSEKLELEIVYRPIEVDPYGLTTIEATCKSAKVTRTGISSKSQGRGDAAEGAAGRSWTFKVTPTGKITDLSALENLSKELGERAFAASQKSRIKDPDMIMDFIATQWDIWDSIASIKEPLKGLKKGQEWDSKLLAPMPFVSKVGRDVKYQFVGVVESNNVSCARIVSSYKPGAPPADVNMPYGGSFYMRGTFGFLRGYRVLSIDGSGEQLYDIKRGLIKSDIQHYKAEVSASIFGLGSDTIEPNIEINQTIIMTLAK